MLGYPSMIRSDTSNHINDVSVKNDIGGCHQKSVSVGAHIIID
jgi:hypothetical protein